jgi:hypothetical protein
MLGVHPSRTGEMLADGYVQVGEDEHGWVWFGHPDRMCLKPLRTGLCRMDLNHRGRCSTVVFWCDSCDQSRRGEPDQKPRDVNGDVLVVFCFFCTNIERNRR